MIEKEVIYTGLESDGWEERLGGFSKLSYIHRITHNEGCGLFISLKDSYLAISFVCWKGLKLNELETKIIKYKDLCEEFVPFINGQAEMIYRKGLNDIEVEKIKDDFE